MKQLIIALCLFVALPARAWEARVFDGKARDAVTRDLYPRTGDSDETFYSEDYTFTLRMDKGALLHMKFGMSNVLAGEGSAFADGYVRVDKKGERLRKTWEKGTWKWKKTPFGITLGDDLEFRGDSDRMHLRYRTEEWEVKLNLRAVVPGWSPGGGRVQLADQGYVNLTIWPVLDVEGVVAPRHGRGKPVRVRGACILTHAISTLPPQHLPLRWYYFKSSDKHEPLLLQAFQLGEQFGGGTFGWLVAVQKERYVARSHALQIAPADLRETGKAQIPWALYVKDGDGLEGAVKARTLGKIRNRLDKLPPVQANFIRKFVDPTNYSFDAHIEIALPSGRKLKAEGEFRAETIR